jgi:hypothetical protein
VFLDTSWSLNRVYIADLPGVDLPDEVKNRVSYDLVSAQALTRLIRQHLTPLQLNADLSDHQLRLAFDARLESAIPSIRGVANHVARTIGRYFGYVLLTLKRGDRVNRDARPEWAFRHWDHWAQIERVWLGGGLVSGNLGPHIARHARQVMQEGGVEDFVVHLSPYAAHLPLVGAARYAPPGTDSAVVLDFGGTMIKRARAVFEKDHLVELHRLPSQPVHWTSVGAFDETTPEQAGKLVRDMAATIAKTWRRASAMGPSHPADTLAMSVAAYVQDGNPLVTQAGLYMQTNLVTQNLAAELARRVSTELNRSISIKLLHDGSAAATTYAGERHTAVITIGTAMGIGFPGDDAGLRAISDRLQVITTG